MKRIQSLLLSRYMVSGFIFLSGIFFVMLSISLFFQHRLLWIWIYIVTLFALGFYALSRFFLFLFKKSLSISEKPSSSTRFSPYVSWRLLYPTLKLTPH